MGEKQIRLDYKTEREMLSSELQEKHSALELLDYQDKVRYLVRYAIKHIKFEKPIKSTESSKELTMGPKLILIDTFQFFRGAASG